MTSEKMTIIITIQIINNKLGKDSNFYLLDKLSIEKLRQIQDKLIPVYNQSIKNKG